MSNFDKAKYDIEYNKKNYKRIPLDLKFYEYDKIKNYCDDFGLSVNGFIKMCCAYCIDNVHIDELKLYKSDKK